MPNKCEVVVITGASGGIGRATARKFAADGARIALIARGRRGLEAAARDVEQAGGEAIALLAVDVSDHDQVQAAASAAEDAFGPIDVWVNDAMVTVYAEFLDIEPAEFRRATDVSYLGMVWGTRAALQRMLPRDHGSIVQVCSAMSYRGIPLQAPYCGAKHACKGFTESVLTELLGRNAKVQVSMIQLPVNTTQFTWGRTKLPKQTRPVPPIYQPEVAADAIHYAAHHRRRQIYVGIPTAMNILGERVAPWLLDRYLAKTGYKLQMTDHDLDPHGHDNLFEPVDEDRGSHGPFDEQAHGVSPQYELAKRRSLLLAGAGLAVAGAAAGRLRS